MITVKLNLEDIRNIDGFCIQIQNGNKITILDSDATPKPPSFPWPPFPSILHSPTPTGGGVEWQELCVGKSPSLTFWAFQLH